MACLFTINSKGNAIIRPEATKLAPEFAYLSDKEMLCIILTYDHYSIYRQFPEDERRRRAKASVFGMDNESFFDQPKILKAIELYKGLQYDHRRNQIITYKRKLDGINLVIDSLDEKEFKELSSLMTTSTKLRAAIKEIEAEINQEEEDSLQEDESKNKLSFLEKLQANVARYKEVTAKKENKPKK